MNTVWCRSCRQSIGPWDGLVDGIRTDKGYLCYSCFNKETKKLRRKNRKLKQKIKDE